jgi:hypothetical protein
MRRNICIVQVVELIGQALIGNLRVPERQDVVVADGEARCAQGIVLWWRIELELVVAGDVSRATSAVLEGSTGEGENEGVGVVATGWCSLLQIGE